MRKMLYGFWKWLVSSPPTKSELLYGFCVWLSGDPKFEECFASGKCANARNRELSKAVTHFLKANGLETATKKDCLVVRIFRAIGFFS